MIPDFVINPDLTILQTALNNRDWLNAAAELTKLRDLPGGELFVDRAFRLAFGPALRDLGCTCVQVFTIVAHADGVGCEQCQTVLCGQPFEDNDEKLEPDEW